MKVLVTEPESYIKLRKLMENPVSSIEDFTEVVCCDPNLTATVLKIVNGAFFGLPGKIDNISRAVSLLGIGQLYDIVFGDSEMGSLGMSGNLAYLPVVDHIVPGQRLA